MIFVWKLERSAYDPHLLYRCRCATSGLLKAHRRPYPAPETFDVTFAGVSLDPNCADLGLNSRQVVAGAFDGTYTLARNHASASWDWELTIATPPFTLNDYAAAACAGAPTTRTNLLLRLRWQFDLGIALSVLFSAFPIHWVFASQNAFPDPRECHEVPNALTGHSYHNVGDGGTALVVPMT